MTHRAARKLKVSPKTVHLASGFAAVLLIAGFILYNNIPNLAMRVASARAGVPASLPAYQPSGFALSGAIQYSPGEIRVSYQSNSDNRSFKLIQKTTDWTNQALLENFVAANDRAYQTFENQGQTIYIYDGSNAVWLDNGIWYQIEGASSLNSDQLIRLATSI